MVPRTTLKLCLLLATLASGTAPAAEEPGVGNGCLLCHADERSGFNTAHAFAVDHCAACHAGDPQSGTVENAHAGLIPFPGDLATASRACGGCHAGRVFGVTHSLMHTGRGMVEVTRRAIGVEPDPESPDNLQSLGHGVADSMLRKQCASCHLGQPKTTHTLDVTHDRGGGCVACHINDYPDAGHPALTTQVDDGRCFGCHSRSGRISLSYAGLAETIPAGEPDGGTLRLADGRFVQRMPADVHYLAGMSCIDCHSGAELMQAADNVANQRHAMQVACVDCHTDNIAPVPNAELRDGNAWLQTKNTGRELFVPPADPATPGHDANHGRVTCAACHSQWAPRCFGCHMEYDADGEQWDHVERKTTPGRWSDRRWNIDNGLPALGVNDNDEIEAFVPGMIMTITHPALPEEKFVRQFAPLSPHTVGPARSCESCHRSSEALGLGQGDIDLRDGELRFAPRHEILRDGLPADAWTNPGSTLGGQAPFPGQRPFNYAEMQMILDAWIATQPAAGD